MSSEVKRYDAVHLRYEDCNIRYGEGCEVEVVTASDYAAIEAECERLRQFEIAYNDWQAKTDWVQESAKSHELGRHRADVLRARIDALAAELAAIKGQELRADPVKAQLLEALEASNTLLRIKRHACGNTEVCRVLDTHITRNSAAIAAARKEGGE